MLTTSGVVLRTCYAAYLLLSDLIAVHGFKLMLKDFYDTRAYRYEVLCFSFFFMCVGGGIPRIAPPPAPMDAMYGTHDDDESFETKHDNGPPVMDDDDDSDDDDGPSHDFAAGTATV